jgi:hypothetical protein
VLSEYLDIAEHTVRARVTEYSNSFEMKNKLFDDYKQFIILFGTYLIEVDRMLFCSSNTNKDSFLNF